MVFRRSEHVENCGPTQPFVLVVLFLGLGCTAEETSYEHTTYARIRSEQEQPMCEGDRLKIDARIESVAEQLGLPPGNVEIHFFPGPPVPGCNSSFGCFVDGVARATSQSLDHEIVHAVAEPLGPSRKLWEEGLAEALSGRFVQASWDETASVMSEWDATTTVELDYALAGHFAKWLLTTYGVDPYLQVYRGASVERAYGMPLEALSLEYEASAPWGYASEACLEPVAAVVADETTEEFEIDCSEDGVRHLVGLYPDSVALSKNIEIQRAGSYELELDGGWGSQILRCLPRVVDDVEPSTVDGSVYHDGDVAPPVPVMLGSQPAELVLDPGVYRLTVYGTPGLDQETVALSLRRN